jgi:Tol biopolymer transport system component/DNA-binding winged helix-turn-helix (wHTH) protein
VIYQFDDIRVDLQQMAITRNGSPVEVEPKAFDVLRHLLEHRDRLVTKEELLNTVWRDTFVTPNVLTRVVAQLRKALGDDAYEPRYIETVAKRGYRFIARETPPVPAAIPTAPDPPRAAIARTVDPIRAAALVVAIVLAGLAMIRLMSARSQRDLSLPSAKKLTTRMGINTTPAMSPDSRAVAYVSDRTGSLELYVLGLAPGSQEIAITNDGGQNMEPAWSPDGRWIAFHSRARGGIWIVSSTGGTPRQIVERGSDPAWSPDSARLVYTPDEGGMAGQQILKTVNRDGTDSRPLTRLGSPVGGHNHPAWSHNGRFIAFAVSNGVVNHEIWIVDAAGGEPRLLTSSHAASHPQFTSEDTALLWTGDVAESNSRLFRIGFDAGRGAAVGGVETVMPFDNGRFDGLSISRDGTVAFSVETADTNLWTIDLAGNGTPSVPARLTDDTVRNARPEYSADGRIAFVQIGAGRPWSVWVINEDGTNRLPLAPDGTSGNPNWSRDGRRVLIAGDNTDTPALWWVDVASRRATPTGIDARGFRSSRLSPDSTEIAFHMTEPNGAMNVWTLPLDGRPRKRITNDREAISYPGWSPDGRWLAVEMKRGERTNIGVIPRDGGTIEQLTNEPGQSWPHSWSPDGEHIAYAAERNAVWNVWEVARRTREARQLTHFTSSSGYVRYPSWSPRGNRIAFEREMRTATVWTIQLPDN